MFSGQENEMLLVYGFLFPPLGSKLSALILLERQCFFVLWLPLRFILYLSSSAVLCQLISFAIIHHRSGELSVSVVIVFCYFWTILRQHFSNYSSYSISLFFIVIPIKHLLVLFMFFLSSYFVFWCTLIGYLLIIFSDTISVINLGLT